MLRKDFKWIFFLLSLITLVMLYSSEGIGLCNPQQKDAENCLLSPGKDCLCSANLQYIFLEKPEAFSSCMEVAGCYCEYEGKVLYLLRHPKKPQGNTWCIPGGKLEKGESPLDAIIREVTEETGLKLSKEDLVYCRKVYVRLPSTKDFVLHLFRVSLAKMPKKLKIARQEHSTYRWVTFEEALQLPLIPGGGDCLRLAMRTN